VSWKIGAAKQRFSEVVRRAANAPQPIHNREQLVATVIGPEDSRLFLEWRKRHRAPMSEALREARHIASETSYELTVPRRIDRPNALRTVSDARRHQRRQ
jgi:hypothetical protein